MESFRILSSFELSVKYNPMSYYSNSKFERGRRKKIKEKEVVARKGVGESARRILSPSIKYFSRGKDILPEGEVDDHQPPSLPPPAIVRVIFSFAAKTFSFP